MAGERCWKRGKCRSGGGVAAVTILQPRADRGYGCRKDENCLTPARGRAAQGDHEAPIKIVPPDLSSREYDARASDELRPVLVKNSATEPGRAAGDLLKGLDHVVVLAGEDRHSRVRSSSAILAR